MAPITCPQCNNEISACPHCGFSFADEEGFQEIQEAPPKTRLSEPQRSLPLGIGFTVAGVLGMIGSLFLIMTSLTGIVFFVVSMLGIVLGSSLIIGFVIADCPLCGKKIHLAPNSRSAACPHCKTLCVCKGGYLEVL